MCIYIYIHIHTYIMCDSAAASTHAAEILATRCRRAWQMARRCASVLVHGTWGLPTEKIAQSQ